MASPMDGMFKDGNLEFSGGMDSDTPPSFLARNQTAFATNTTFRGGKSSPRPGFIKRPLTFLASVDSSGHPVTPAQNQTAFETAMFQHADFFDGAGIPMLMSVHGGRVWRTDVKNWTVREVTPVNPDGTPDANDPTKKRGWSVQAENYWIYQDNSAHPIIFNGANSRRALPRLSQVPTGNVMCYAMGRLAVALQDNQSFRIGDLVFGPSGTPQNGYRDAVLYFTENNYLNEGGDFVARVFGAPSAYGPITCMKAVAMENMQLGQGPMIIGTPNVVFTVNLPFDRTTWKNQANALQTVNPIIGPLAQDSAVLVNSDLWYRSLDGIRSYIIGLRDFNAGWGNTPQSSELSRYLDYDTEAWLQYGSGALFDNRLLMTTSPMQSPMGFWHRGMAVLDFNLISKLTGNLPPVWEGIWTGLRILKIVRGLVDQKARLFIWALTDSNTIDLWEMDPNRRFDATNTPIVRTMDFPSYNCGDGFALKKLETGEIFIDEVEGDWSLEVTYKSDQNPCPQPWDSFASCAADETCNLNATPGQCLSLPNLQRQFRSKLMLHTPPDTFDTINNRKFRTGYEFQPSFKMTGAYDVKQFRIGCLSEPEGAHGERKVV